MHELSIAICIVDEVSTLLPGSTEGMVVAVHLQLGKLAGVDKAALLFCYAAACEGSPLAGSRLLIEEVPVTIFCEYCKLESSPEFLHRLVCPACLEGGSVVRGHEMEITGMELAA